MKGFPNDKIYETIFEKSNPTGSMEYAGGTPPLMFREFQQLEDADEEEDHDGDEELDEDALIWHQNRHKLKGVTRTSRQIGKVKKKRRTIFYDALC